MTNPKSLTAAQRSRVIELLRESGHQIIQGYERGDEEAAEWMVAFADELAAKESRKRLHKVNLICVWVVFALVVFLAAAAFIGNLRENESCQPQAMEQTK